jgi:hypothetical protein
MIGIQKQKFISQNLFVIQVSGLHQYKGNSQGYYFFWLLHTVVNFNVGTPGGMTNIQTLFNLCPHVLSRVVGYCSHRIPYASLQLLKIMVFDLVDELRKHWNTRCLENGSAECQLPAPPQGHQTWPHRFISVGVWERTLSTGTKTAIFSNWNPT